MHPQSRRYTPRGTPAPVRFWSYVDRSGGPDACWPWMGARYANGYGQFRVGTRRVSAHRFAYEDGRGPIPDGLEPDHLCGNRACCNPAHLEAVTHAENMRRGSVAQRTHCERGHAYTPENTARAGSGARVCRTCNRLAQAAWRARREVA